MIRVPDPTRLGAALADLRTIHRLSRRAVAAAIGMHESQYGQYELGHKLPSVETLLKLLKFHGYDLALIPREDA